MARQQIVAGNWKMNKNLIEGKLLLENILKSNFSLKENQKVIIAPPYIQLPIAAVQLKDKKNFYLAAQNCHQKPNGAYTGEISAEMLRSTGVDYVILGHSERRQYFGEDETILNDKVDAALAQDLKIIFCVGESLKVRDAGEEKAFVKQQILGSLSYLSLEQFANVVIAYEPIWAIGSGRTATKEQAQEMHAHIRNVIAEKCGNYTAGNLPILYGGSCKPDNAEELFIQPDVDGGLIGGASLKADDFAAIIQAM